MTAPDGLVVEGLRIRFGGLVALDDADLVAPSGVITGLIGPNGAGKSTLLAACAGQLHQERGTISLDGRRLDDLPPARRAGLGLGRTFQRTSMLAGTTVHANVALGPECVRAGRGWSRQLRSSAEERREVLAAADDALDRCGIADLAGALADDLSTGQRRLVELARAVASGFHFLLLDEPSSGLDATETSVVATVLRDLVATSSTGILLVEHDMALVRAVCSEVVLLEFGRTLLQGPTVEVLESETVRAAYLGSLKAV
jgi:ABC-type branched-subunit amino acid transport system ATPase component